MIVLAVLAGCCWAVEFELGVASIELGRGVTGAVAAREFSSLEVDGCCPGVTGMIRLVVESGTTAAAVHAVDAVMEEDSSWIVAAVQLDCVDIVEVRTPVEVITGLFMTMHGRCTTNLNGVVPDFCTILVSCFSELMRTWFNE